MEFITSANLIVIKMLSTKRYYWFIAEFIMCHTINVTSVTIALVSIFETLDQYIVT